MAAQQFWMQKKQYQKMLLPVVSVLVVVVLTIFVLIPQIKAAVSDMEKAEVLAQRKQVLTEKATMLASLDVAELAIRVKTLSKVLPSDEDIGYFISGIRSMARRAGVIFEGMTFAGSSSPKPIVYGEGVPEVAKRRVVQKPKEFTALIDINLGSNVDSLQEFIRQVETSVPLSTLEEVSLSSARDKVDSARVLLKYYYSPAPELLGGSESPLKVITSAEDQIYQDILGLSEPEVVELPRVPVGNNRLLL